MGIPPRYVYEGDEDKARGLRRFAQVQLGILRDAMAYQELEQDKRTVKFDDGTIIDLNINHGLETAIIYCPVAEIEELEEVEEVTTVVECFGGMLKQGATIGEVPGIKGCIKQGASVSLELCEGAVLPFQDPVIVGNIQPDAFDNYQYQVRGGVPPYTWKIIGKDYYFKNEDGEHVKEDPGHIQAPMCVGGDYGGYYGGIEGITGMLYMLMGGGVINKDVCERGGGYYLYRGTIQLYSEAACEGVLSVKDICDNEAELKLIGPDTFEWDCELSDEEANPNNCAVVWVGGGSPPYTWSSDDSEAVLDAEVTQGRNNSICLSATCCGTATITVVDGCGNVCTGYVRSTTGQWVFCAGSECGPWNCAPGQDYEQVFGIYKDMWRCCQQDWQADWRECSAVCGNRSLTRKASDCPAGFNGNLGYFYIYRWEC